MKPKRWASLFSVSLILLLTNDSSAYAERNHQYTVEPQQMAVGSVPAIASWRTLTYIPNYPVAFVGDSRTVGMKQALSYYGYDLSDCSFTAEIGKGYSWFTGQSSLTSLPPSIIVLNLGVNDLGNLYRYQSIYEEYATTCWSECPIYIVSVNPCSYPCTSVSNQRISAFNSSMEQWIQEFNEENASASAEAIPIRYIDTYHYLLSEGFSSSDGLHYSSGTYERIYLYILDQIQESIGDGTGSYCYTD